MFHDVPADEPELASYYGFVPVSPPVPLAKAPPKEVAPASQ